jgi:23S rRNA (guanosine2251-2'-O)-methyltransferase
LEKRFIYGRNPVAEALACNDGRLEEVFFFPKMDKAGRLLLQECRKQHVKVHECGDRQELFRLCGAKEHQGFVGKAAGLKNASLNHIYKNKSEGLRVLMLSSVQDPHNLGAIIRNCEHFGLDLLILGTKGSCSRQLGSVAKASAGAVEHQAVLETSRPELVAEELVEKNFVLYGLDNHASSNLFEKKPASDENVCLLLGSEDAGIRLSLEKKLKEKVLIPRFGTVNSLNMSAASVVGAIWLKQLS